MYTTPVSLYPYLQVQGVEHEEVWFEHRTGDGRVYYSHPHTHKTMWERPKGARIITPHPTLGQCGNHCHWLFVHTDLDDCLVQVRSHLSHTCTCMHTTCMSHAYHMYACCVHTVCLFPSGWTRPSGAGPISIPQSHSWTSCGRGLGSTEGVV